MNDSASSAEARLGAKPPSSPTLVLWPAAFRRAFQGMEHLSAHAQGLGEGVRAGGDEHELLDVDGIVGVHPAVDDVHQGDRQHPRRHAADIAVERQGRILGRGLGGGEADAQDGVGAQPALVRRAVELDHRRIEAALVLGVEAGERVEQLAVDRVHRLQHALAAVAAVVPVALLHRLVGPCGGAGRDRRATEGTVLQRHIDLDRGIAPAVEDFARGDVDDIGHGRRLSGISEAARR